MYKSPFKFIHHFYHTSFRASQPVQCAGELSIVNKKINVINNHSGHYIPTFDQLLRTLKNVSRIH